MAAATMIPQPVALWLFSAYMFTSSWLSYGCDITEKVVRGVVNSFKADNYVFFSEMPIVRAYSTTVVNMGSSCAAPLDWIYDSNKHMFLDGKNPVLPQKRSSLPFLSLEIQSRANGSVLYDLTDFLETVRAYSDAGRKPTIGHILEAWSLSSGLVINPSLIECLRGMNDDGDPITITYDNAIHGKEPYILADTPSEEAAEAVEAAATAS